MIDAKKIIRSDRKKFLLTTEKKKLVDQRASKYIIALCLMASLIIISFLIPRHQHRVLIQMNHTIYLNYAFAKFVCDGLLKEKCHQPTSLFAIYSQIDKIKINQQDQKFNSELLMSVLGSMFVDVVIICLQQQHN